MEFQWFAFTGIILQIFGFIGMLIFWREPMEYDVQKWKKNQVKIHPKDYEERIKDDWNWYRLPGNMKEMDPREYWWIPKGFGKYWRNAKATSFFLVVGGLILQIIQLFFVN
jgi:hypothetical protein